MKKLFCIILLAICLSTCIFATEPSYNEKQEIFQVPNEWQQIFDDAGADENSMQGISLGSILAKAKNIVMTKINAPLRYLAQMTALLLFAAIARGMCPSSLSGNMYDLLDTVVALAIFGLSSAPALQLISNMSIQVESAKLYISSFVPVFASIMLSCGEVGSAAVYSGIFFTCVMFIAGLLCQYALPGLRIFLALGIVGSINDEIDFGKICNTFAKIIRWTLTISATVFASVLGIQGALAVSADNLAVKAGKLLLSAGVPVIGRAVSDAVGSVYTGLKLMKGTAAAALIVILAAGFVPLLIEGAMYYLALTLGSVIAKGTGAVRNARLLDCICETVSLSMLFVFFFSMMALVSTIMMVLMGGG